MPKKMSDSYTLYILEGTERTKSTRDPLKVVGMRPECGPRGTITTWRVDLDGPEPKLTRISVVTWPHRSPDFPGWPGQDMKLE
jgi:hypothetical protein